MKKRRRTEITIETAQVRVIRKPGRTVSIWCPQCRASATMITPEQAMVLAGVSSRTIYRWVESGQVHYRETPEGFLFVCLNSLTR